MCAHDMLDEIVVFATSVDHGALVSLVIMSHGDEFDNIEGNDRTSTCSVQQVVDALCHSKMSHSTKVFPAT